MCEHKDWILVGTLGYNLFFWCAKCGSLGKITGIDIHENMDYDNLFKRVKWQLPKGVKSEKK